MPSDKKQITLISKSNTTLSFTIAAGSPEKEERLIRDKLKKREFRDWVKKANGKWRRLDR